MDQSNEQGTVTIADHLMAQVPKEFFFDGMVLPTPVYLKLKQDSYLVIGKKGEKAQMSNLHVFKKDEAVVYVKSVDHNHFIQFATDFTSKVLSQRILPDKLKTKFLYGLAEDTIRSFDGKKFASVTQLQKVSGLLIEFTRSTSGFSQILKMLEALPENEAKHAFATCMIALAISEDMKMTHNVAQEKLAMGALLHDVGLNFVSKEILNKPRHLWTQEELNEYQQHPLKGAEMLRDLKDISNDVLLIVVEHHENSVGTGFPKRLRDVKLSPLGKIVGLANYFASMLFNQHPEGRIYTADEAISYIDDVLGQPFNKQVFSSLKNIVNKNLMAEKLKA